VFSNDPTKRPGPENKPSVGEKERINNNAAIIMSLAPKVYPAYVFLRKCSREDFSQTLSVFTTRGEQKGSSSGVLIASLFLPVCSSQRTATPLALRTHYQ